MLKKEILSSSNSFSILHLNIHSIERHIEELKVVLELLDFRFDILCFLESKIVDGKTPRINITLKDIKIQSVCP